MAKYNDKGIKKIYTLSDLGYPSEYTMLNAAECLIESSKKFALEYSL